MKRGSSKDQSLKLYVAAKKYGRRHNREPRVHTSPLVEYSKRNPDEKDTVLEAQWRIQEARQREGSLQKRMLALLNELLGTPWISSSPTPILEHIVLGSRENAANREQLYSAGITHVCNCALQVANYFEGEFVYVKLHLHDSVNEELIPHFQTVAAFLRRVESLRGRALIHCISGVSRSPALLVAYLMIDKHMRLIDAYNLVRRKRKSVQPNQAFRLQLAKFELMLFGASSVAKTQDKDWNFYAWHEFQSTASVSRISTRW
uniref:protein-tyrosine-phosphatase n=1 Tax=Globisporangium ultimum (strain ATCC 200006 / CBS 805.95 / DAOM BR144) TaxID=431595 RepID=K3XC22_GLOUD